MATAPSPSAKAELEAQIGELYPDPLGFVRLCFPWGEPGPAFI
jgi:hypothetical protein